jgi:hypothetical protein
MFKENKELLDCFIEPVTGRQEESMPNNSLDKDVSDFLLAVLESKIIEILQESKKISAALYAIFEAPGAHNLRR